MGTARVKLKPSGGAIQLAVALGILTVLSAASAAATTAPIGRAIVLAITGVSVAVAACSAWRVRCWVDVGRDAVTIHHAALLRPLRIPAAQLTAVVAGDPYDLDRPADLPRPVALGEFRPHLLGRTRSVPASLVVSIAEPIAIRPMRGARFTAEGSLALVAADPAAAARAFVMTLGVPVRHVEPASGEVREARRSRRRRALVVAVMAPLTFLLATTVRALSAPDRPAVVDDHGRAWLPGVPAVPGARRSSYTELADGSRVFTWQTADDELRVRVDTAPARCGDAGWLDVWHATDLRSLELDGDGAFRRTARYSETYDGGADAVAVRMEGIVGATTIRGRLRRTDRYRGLTSATCTRTLRFAVPRD